MQSFFSRFVFLLFFSASIAQSTAVDQGYTYFLDLFHTTDAAQHQRTLKQIERSWHPSYEILAIESLYFLKHPTTGLRLLQLLQRKTKKQYAYDFNKWYAYIWNKDATYTDHYFNFKALLHRAIDPKFGMYFAHRAHQSSIRLDEVRWGGVVQDGIPPLRNPQMVASTEASYLDEDDIVFGIVINGDARAYPKRILAWHELFLDTVGETSVAGVYCTLCGTMIVYNTSKDGVHYQLGTSGFLYRSNKLMYDQETQSLWNTLWGKPVIGPLATQEIELDYISVVTTTWGAWKQLHPTTTVLSLQTGYRRDYSEGSAYKSYFATDRLMFPVPKQDRRLKNKQEVLAIRWPSETNQNIAISSKFLAKHPIYSTRLGEHQITVFTDTSGAHRVYLTGTTIFTSYTNTTAMDQAGNSWHISEEKLTNPLTGQQLLRLPTHNAFWFGYQAAFPEVTLIK